MMSAKNSGTNRLPKLNTARLGTALLAASGLVAPAAYAEDSQAAAGAASMSTSSVQLYGLIGMYIDSSKLSSTRASTVQEGGGGMTTSFWGMRGKEDIGGGNAVFFALESFLQAEHGADGTQHDGWACSRATPMSA
jgi:predicted porin